MDEFYNKHYITVDDVGRITSGWSNGPHPNRDTSDAICINEQGGYQFRLYPGGEENPMLVDWDGIPLYRWDGEAAVLRSKDAIEQDRASVAQPEQPAQPPTQPPTQPNNDSSVWEELDAAYREGVNSAYDS